MAEALVYIYVYFIVLPLFYLVFPACFLYSLYYLLKNLNHKQKIHTYIAQSILVFAIGTLIAHFHHILGDVVSYFEFIKWLYYILLTLYALTYMLIPFLPYFISKFYLSKQLKSNYTTIQQICSAYFIFSIVFFILLYNALPQKLENGIGWGDLLYLPNIINISQVFDILQL